MFSRSLLKPIFLKWLLLFSLFLTLHSQALELPRGLNASEREKVIRQLGIPTSAKFLSNPYPLGGYTGIEFGLSYQVIPVDEISLLGQQKPENERSLPLVEFSVGKGLYNNIDFFFQFAPYDELEKVNSYGGLLKWGFYEAKFSPIHLSLLIQGSVFHVSDSFVNQTLGAELMAGVNVDNLAVYFGLGMLQGEGQFMGGQTGVVDDGITVKHQQKLSHLFVGLNYNFSHFFISAQLDRYVEPTFSGKLGMRF